LADRRGRLWPALDVVAPDGMLLEGPERERLLLMLDDLLPTAVEETACRWRVYFADGAQRAHAAARLRDDLGAGFVVERVDVEDEGWAHKVQADLGAVTVGRFVVAPPWDAALSRDAQVAGADILIVIEPSTGFGTGHHQSTRLCLTALQALPLEGARVLDVGTGSGVLAIAASRLGAREVVAVDNDPDSIAAAQENVTRNGVGSRVIVRLDDLASLAVPPSDIVVANVTAWILCQHAPALTSLVRPGGHLVLGGFTRDQVPLVTGGFPGWSVTARDEEDDWVALTLAWRA
jgi:ribosomal protein L11 methyltransferase